MYWRERDCVVEGCQDKQSHMRLGLCNGHYLRLARYGTFERQRNKKGLMKDWIAENLDHKGEECLVWPFSRSLDGRATGLKNVSRYICEQVHGKVDSHKIHARHLCGKAHEGCVNPRHLEWSTVSVNQMDRVDHGTSNRGEANGKSKLAEIDVIDICVQLNLGNNIQNIADEFNVSFATIYDIKAKRRWSWLTEGVLND